MTIRCQVEIKNRLGLHARPAMKLFELIQTFRSTVVFRNKQNEEARADSVLAMLMLDGQLPPDDALIDQVIDPATLFGARR